jgi:hypothetical protein
MRTRHVGIAVLLGGTLAAGCATVRQLMALKSVDFSIERVSGVRLAGIDVSRIRGTSDLTLMDAAHLTTALAARNVPLDLVIHLRADNPADNPTARLLRMQWSLFLDSTQTISGLLDSATSLPSGQATDVPLVARMNLMEFMHGGASELLTLARALAGAPDAHVELRLRATPTIDTPLGAITYPGPITIVRRQIGQ